jgi:hypothetical protein
VGPFEKIRLDAIRQRRCIIPAAVDDDSTGVSGGWYRAPGWRARARERAGAERNSYRPKLTHSSWVSFKGGWYKALDRRAMYASPMTPHRSPPTNGVATVVCCGSKTMRRLRFLCGGAEVRRIWIDSGSELRNRNHTRKQCLLVPDRFGSSKVPDPNATNFRTGTLASDCMHKWGFVDEHT